MYEGIIDRVRFIPKHTVQFPRTRFNYKISVFGFNCAVVIITVQSYFTYLTRDTAIRMLQRVGMQFHAVIGECNHARFRDFHSNRVRAHTERDHIRYPCFSCSRQDAIVLSLSERILRSRCNLMEI